MPSLRRSIFETTSAQRHQQHEHDQHGRHFAAGHHAHRFVHALAKAAGADEAHHRRAADRALPAVHGVRHQFRRRLGQRAVQQRRQARRCRWPAARRWRGRRPIRGSRRTPCPACRSRSGRSPARRRSGRGRPRARTAAPTPVRARCAAAPAASAPPGAAARAARRMRPVPRREIDSRSVTISVAGMAPQQRQRQAGGGDGDGLPGFAQHHLQELGVVRRRQEVGQEAAGGGQALRVEQRSTA